MNPLSIYTQTTHRAAGMQSPRVANTADNWFDTERSAGSGRNGIGQTAKFSDYMAGFMDTAGTSLGRDTLSPRPGLQEIHSGSRSVDCPREATVNEPAELTMMDTNKGTLGIDLNAYFSTDTREGKIDLLDVPLLMPSEANIEALTSHVSAGFESLLKTYGIPTAPEQITYDNSGQMVLPQDYPYAEKLALALNENPGLARELQTLNALSSHYAEIQKRIPFVEAYGQAQSPSQIGSVLARYASFLQDTGSYGRIALNFSGSGELTVTADGQPV